MLLAALILQSAPQFLVKTTPHYRLLAPASGLRKASKELDESAARFKKYFGEEAPQVVFVVPGAQTSWENSPAPELTRRGIYFFYFNQTKGKPMPDGTLAHEAGHQYFMHFVTKVETEIGVRGEDKDTYGHGAMPDWLDEAAACLCESDKDKRFHRSALLASPNKRIPLAKLLTMNFPRPKVLTELEKKRKHNEMVVGKMTPAEFAYSKIFYGESLTLAEYIFAKGGPKAMKNIVRAWLYPMTLQQHLRASGIPSDIAFLEREYLKWLRTRKQQ